MQVWFDGVKSSAFGDQPELASRGSTVRLGLMLKTSYSLVRTSHSSPFSISKATHLARQKQSCCLLPRAAVGGGSPWFAEDKLRLRLAFCLCQTLVLSSPNPFLLKPPGVRSLPGSCDERGLLHLQALSVRRRRCCPALRNINSFSVTWGFAAVSL